MGMRPVELVEGEWYHCYSRTVDRLDSYREHGDYVRFVESMYLANSLTLINRGSFKRRAHESILSLKRGSPLVAIGAYALMPNHFHLLLQQIEPSGISHFMHRLGTSYSMYFNLKYTHIGNVFVRPFRAKHVDTDVYLQKVSEYIHLNPVDVLDQNWRMCNPQTAERLVPLLKQYKYSSLPDYLGVVRPENSLIANTADSPIRPFDETRLDSLLAEASEFYDGTTF